MHSCFICKAEIIERMAVNRKTGDKIWVVDGYCPTCDIQEFNWKLYTYEHGDITNTFDIKVSPKVLFEMPDADAVYICDVAGKKTKYWRVERVE